MSAQPKRKVVVYNSQEEAEEAIMKLTKKLKARKKETKDFLKMIEGTNVSSKVKATVDLPPEEEDGAKVNYIVLNFCGQDEEDEGSMMEFGDDEEPLSLIHI